MKHSQDYDHQKTPSDAGLSADVRKIEFNDVDKSFSNFGFLPQIFSL